MEEQALRRDETGSSSDSPGTLFDFIYATSIHEKYRTEIELGFTFLEKGTPVRNRVANPDGSLDHPVYSTSMYLVASHRLGRELEPAIVEPLLIYLVSSQCTEGRGFNPSNPNHGGWDVIGPDVQPGKTAGTNVSATRFVLEAFNSYVPLTGQATVRIKDSVIESVSKSRQQAAVWLKRVQNMNRDGGFRFFCTAEFCVEQGKHRGWRCTFLWNCHL